MPSRDQSQQICCPSRAPGRSPASAKLSFDDPFVIHRETDAVEVKANRQFHAGDLKEGNDLLDVAIGVQSGIHGWNSWELLAT
jgi:hypothetical protein